MKTKEKAPISTTAESGQGCEDLLTREQAAVMVVEAVRKVRTEEAEHAKLLQAWWFEKLEEAKQEAEQLQRSLEYCRAQNEQLQKDLEYSRDQSKKRLGQIHHMRWELGVERKERAAAQRTVALLGGGIDE